MIDFKESFNTGIQSAKKGEESRREIQGVFDDLNDQLTELTNGKVKISRVQFYQPHNPLKMSFLEPRKSYWAIAAENPKSEQGSTEELAKWSMDRAGYPCEITLGNDYLSCEDKESLENGLSEVLQDPLVGEILSKLLRLPDKEPTVNDDTEENN
jgi:hypothetical protein